MVPTALSRKEKLSCLAGMTKAPTRLSASIRKIPPGRAAAFSCCPSGTLSSHLPRRSIVVHHALASLWLCPVRLLSPRCRIAPSVLLRTGPERRKVQVTQGHVRIAGQRGICQSGRDLCVGLWHQHGMAWLEHSQLEPESPSRDCVRS